MNDHAQHLKDKCVIAIKIASGIKWTKGGKRIERIKGVNHIEKM